MRPTVTDRVAWSVGLSVGLSVTVVSPARTTEPIGWAQETMYWMGGPDSPWEAAILREAAHYKVYGHSAVSCAKAAKPIEMPFGIWTGLGPGKHVGAHWRNLTNTTEQSTCGSDAACCQIILNTC